MTGLPRYVEFGLGSSYPGPFECRDGNMRMLLLEGDAEKIAGLVDRVYNVPAKGVVEYRPVLGGRVMLLYGLNIVSSATSPWSEFGRVAEQLAAFWVPVWAGRAEGGGGFKADRLCMSVPHILVDNPISHLAGREIYGFPKALGRFTFERPGEEVRVEGYGGPFDPEVTAAWRPLLEIEPVGARPVAESEGPELEGSEGLVDELAAVALEGSPTEAAGDGVELPDGVRVVAGLCEQIRSGVMQQLFVKQFRDAGVQDHACYQAVVEAPAKTLRVRWRPSLRDWKVTIHPLESHPITAELGISSQIATWSAKLTSFDFDEGVGRVVAP